MQDYQQFIQSKHERFTGTGFEHTVSNPHPFDWQRDIAQWSIRKGRAAIFADCGMGKSLLQLLWSEAIHGHTGGPVLVLAPIAVSDQTVGESIKFQIGGPAVRVVESQSDVGPGINITNYEKLHKFEPGKFAGVCLDESSILKNYTGKTKQALIQAFSKTDYRLACTATPSPNDLMELGNHSEFLGVLPSNEMISRFFMNDSMHAGRYTLKRHAADKFWDWVASWAVCLSSPADLGYSSEGYTLPGLEITETVIGCETAPEGLLFNTVKPNATNLNRIRRASLEERCAAVAEIVNRSADQFCVWCKLNDEADLLSKLISDSVNVQGKDSGKVRAERFLGFADGRHRVLITKPEIGGWGMNWQHCHRMTWFPSFSFEEFYQCVRRFYRFGQTQDVRVDVVMTETESGVHQNLLQKQMQHGAMHSEMAKRMADSTLRELGRQHVNKPAEYNPSQSMRIPAWLTPKPYGA